MEPNNHIILIISLSSLLLSLSVEAICVPRNVSRSDHSPSPFSAPSPQPVPSPSSISLPPVFPPSPVPSPSLLVDPAIQTICDKTDYPILCVTSLFPFLDGKTDPISVLGAAIKASSSHTEEALVEVANLLKDPSKLDVPPSYIEVCQENYKDAIDNLKNAAGALSTGDVGTLNSMLSAALTDYDTCDNTFAETPDFVSPLTKTDERLMNLASNCLAIVTLIH